MYAVGYRPADVGLPQPDSTKVNKGSVVFSDVTSRSRRSRNYRRLNFGFVPGYAPISIDRNDPETVRRGATKRLLRDHPIIDPAELSQFGDFCDKFFKDNFTPVTVTVDGRQRTREWLDQTPYSISRREELWKVAEKQHFGPPSIRQASHVDSFIKLESYPEYKEARWINSRHDSFKVYSGPFFKAIEEEVYKHPSFIKHVPIPDRPQVIIGLRRAGVRYYENDYNAYESSFKTELMKVCECRLYSYMLSRYPQHADRINKTICGQNRLSTRAGVKFVIGGHRMSGEMCTSLGNGVTNLCVFQWIMHKKHQVGGGVVEGDDGLFWTTGTMDENDFAPLGFTVKIKELPDPTRGHFCGMTFGSTGEIIKDPRRVFQTFGWTHSFIGAGNQIMDELLRCKAMSLAYEVPQCPIIGQLARTALDLTRDVIVKHHEDKWGLDWNVVQKNKVQPFKPAHDTRLLFEQMFGISIDQQLAAEEAIARYDMQTLAQIVPPTAAQLDYYSKYLEVG